MSNFVQRLNTLLQGAIWRTDAAGLPQPRRFIVSFLRLIYVLLRELFLGELNLRAMSLVYTTLLSLVPLLAFSFSVLKGLGVHNQIEPMLFHFFEPLGPKGAEITERIVGFVENVQAGVLGSVGLTLLIYTVVSLLQKIEAAFNFVWHVDRLRSLGQRFSSYLSVLMVGPLLVIGAMGITATALNSSVIQHLQEFEAFGALLLLGGRLVPYVMVCAAFTFIYMFIPNTRVLFRAALAGGLVAGILWETAGWMFAAFVASSTRYTAIYSGFAIVLMSLIWLFVSWLILLLGAQLAFFVQNPQYISRHPVRLELSNRMKEKLAFMVMFLIAENHYYNRPPWTVEGLVERLDVPVGPMQRMLAILSVQRFITETADVTPTYLPARDIETIYVVDLLAGVREAEESRFLRDHAVSSMAPVERELERVQAAVRQSLGERNFKSLVLEHAAHAAPGGAGTNSSS